MSSGIVRELSNVRHVPELKRNLISPSMPDKIGCSIRVKSSVLKVVTGSTVLMKGDINNGLYALRGIVVTCKVSLSKLKLNKSLL